MRRTGGMIPDPLLRVAVNAAQTAATAANTLAANARQMVLNRDPHVITQDQTVAALTARVTALENVSHVAAFGRVTTTTPLSLLGGGLHVVTVPFEHPATDTNYIPMVAWDSGNVQLFGALDLVSVTERSTTQCKVTLKNTALVSLNGTVAVTVVALRM